MGGESLNNLTPEQIAEKVTEAENTIKMSEVYIARFKSLEVLMKTDEYDIIFNSGFFGEYANEMFEELTNPPQFAKIPFKDCEDLLAGIKALKSYVGITGFPGKVEQDAVKWSQRRDSAQTVINAIGY